MVNGISGIGAPQQERPKYDKLTLVDTKTNKKTTKESTRSSKKSSK